MSYDTGADSNGVDPVLWNPGLDHLGAYKLPLCFIHVAYMSSDVSYVPQISKP